MKKANDIEIQLMMTCDVSRDIWAIIGTPTQPKNFNIGSPIDAEIQRKLTFDGSNEPRLPPPLMATATSCPAVRTVPSGSGNPQGMMSAEPMAPKAPPSHLMSRFNGVRNHIHILANLAPPSQKAGQCQCCNGGSSKSGRALLITQQQHNMADAIRKPRRHEEMKILRMKAQLLIQSLEREEERKEERDLVVEIVEVRTATRMTVKMAKRGVLTKVMTGRIGGSTVDSSNLPSHTTGVISHISSHGWKC